MLIDTDNGYAKKYFLSQQPNQIIMTPRHNGPEPAVDSLSTVPHAAAFGPHVVSATTRRRLRWLWKKAREDARLEEADKDYVDP